MPVNTPVINLEIPDFQDTTGWNNEVDQWAQKLDEAAQQFFVLQIAGEAIDEEIVFNDFKFNVPVVISSVSMFARSGPAGAAFSIDFLKNNVEQTKLASIADGSTSGSAAIAGLSYDPTPGTPELMGLKIKSVGSTNAGAEITVVIHFNVQPVP